MRIQSLNKVSANKQIFAKQGAIENLVTSYFCHAKASGKAPKELFLPSLMLTSRQRLSSEMRTQSKFASKFGDGSIRTESQQSKKDTRLSVLFALLVTRTGIEPMLQP